METITKIPNWSECRDWVTAGCLAPADTSSVQCIHLKLKENHGRRGRKVTKARGPGTWSKIISLDLRGKIYSWVLSDIVAKQNQHSNNSSWHANMDRRNSTWSHTKLKSSSWSTGRALFRDSFPVGFPVSCAQPCTLMHRNDRATWTQ